MKTAKKVLSFSRWTTQQMWLNRWKSGNSINNNFKGKNIPNGARWLIGRARQKHNEQEKGHETKEKRLSEEKEGKSHESCWRSRTGGSLPRQRLTSLMAVQNSLWRTFFRDWSLCPGTSPDSCSFSSSSMALATSGRYRVREEGEAVECTCVGTHAKGMEGEGGEKKCPPFNYINSTAMRKAPERINGWDNGNRLSEGQLGQERSFALARLYAFRSRTEE